MRSRSPADRAGRSMPARWNWRSKAGASMAQTENASPERVAAFRTGVSAESRAAAFLLAEGYRILAKRFRTPYGEIDLVARKRNLIAFVEVKARASLDDAAWAVTPRQQQRIVNAAQAWLMPHPEHAEFEMRFDAMLIAPKSLTRHLLAAFDACPEGSPESRTPMQPNVAVQMDPIARINIRGDSTFALLLEAQKRGHGISYYTPEQLSMRREEL